MNVQDHVTGSVDFGGVGVGRTAVQEVCQSLHYGLSACVDLCCKIIECMHGGIIHSSGQAQEFSCDLLEMELLFWGQWC